MADVAEIIAKIKEMDSSLEVTEDAAQGLTAIPGFVLSMALTSLVNKAKEKGVTKIDADLVKEVNPM